MILLALFISQIITIFIIYRYVLVNYILQPRLNHPHIFHNQKIALFLTIFPWGLFISNIIVGFIFTDNGWSFLFSSIIMFIIMNSNSRRKVVLKRDTAIDENSEEYLKIKKEVDEQFSKYK